MLRDAGTRLGEFIGSEEATELLWLGALAAIERAVSEARDGDPWLWRSRAMSIVRRFERDLAGDLLEAAKAVKRRKEQTIPAELARRVNAIERQRAADGLPPSELVQTDAWRRKALSAIRAGRPLPPL